MKGGIWEEPAARLALLELLTRGKLLRRRAQVGAFEVLAELPWTRLTGRRDEIALVEARRGELVALLERFWPDWRSALADLAEHGLPPTPEGWSRLLDRRRARDLPDLPERLNRRTAAALAAPHSKSTLTATRLAALGSTEATHDGILRLRPPAGTWARTQGGRLDLSAIAAVLGEVAIPERAFRDGLTLEGEWRALLLVENLGAWRDLPAPEGFLVAHVPGWDTATVAHLFEQWHYLPIFHFGDLDPNGVRIYLHLREKRPDLRYFVPAFWSELVAAQGLPGLWPPDLELDSLPPLLRELAEREVWLEQERIVLDPRLREALLEQLPVSSQSSV